MRRYSIHINWRFFIFGFLLGILFSGIFLLLNNKSFTASHNRVLLPAQSYNDELQIEDKNISIEGKININKATAEELMTLPGIGPAKASAIVLFRERYGAFENVEELLYVPGIGKELFSILEPLIVIP